MGKRIGTKQRKTRDKYKVGYRNRGKISLSKYFQEFQEGDLVSLKIIGNVQEGRFYPRFHGLTGRVTGKRGSCYQVKIRDQGKEKLVFVHPIHLKKQ